MVKLFPIRSVVPVTDSDNSTPTKVSPPNRFRSQSYDRPFGSDDCTKSFGICRCNMCCEVPLVIAAGGDPMCDQFNITLRNVQEYVDGGLLKVHSEEALMIYRQLKSDGTSQIGIFAAIDVDDYARGVLLQHERVTAKTDVTLLNMKKKPAQSHMDPIMVLYRENAKVDVIVQRIMSETEPFQRVSAGTNESDSLSHTLWEVTCPEDIHAIQAAFDGVSAMYIADGHHRAAAAYKESLRLAAGKSAVNVAQSARFLTALMFPDTHLNVLSYNRCVHHLPAGVTSPELLERISLSFDVQDLSALPRPCTPPLTPLFATVDSPVSVSRRMSHLPERSSFRSISSLADESSDRSSGPSSDPFNSPATMPSPCAPTEQSHLLMYLAGEWYSLHLRCKDETAAVDPSQDPLRSIGCQVLLDNILNPIFGMNDSTCDNHMIYVDGRDGAEAVERLVSSGEAAVGFMVSPLSTLEVMRVADAGQLLPAKATFFDPKPMSNILLRLLR